MDWLEALITADRAAFTLVNSTWSNALFDAVLPWCRERWFWAPLYVFVVAWIWLNSAGARRWRLIGGLVLAVGMADFTSSTLIKKNVERPRPCNDLAWREQVILRVPGCGGGYSFTSSHATNHFAVAAFLVSALRLRRKRLHIGLYVWATVIAYAQVYVGVHYPLDVMAGGLLGLLIGHITARILNSVGK